MEEQPKYLVTISALGDVRHYGPETHAGSSFEHLAMCVIIAQQWMHDLIRSFK